MPADDPVRNLALAALEVDAQARDLLKPGAESRIAFSDLYRYATDPAFDLPPGVKAKLAADPTAAADLERIIAAQPFAHMPRQAAAATDDAVRRETDAAVLTLTPSRAAPTQVYLGIQLADKENTGPRQLFARTVSGAWVRETLPAFSGGRAQVLLEADGDMARALGDPETEVYLR